jgi:hypothetical protein
MDYITLIQPYVSAASLGIAYAWLKYRADILDPSKETPLKFEWPKALTTGLIAVVLCIVFTATGQTLNMAGLDTQMGLFAGIATPYIQPQIKAWWRAGIEFLAELGAFEDV